MTETPPETQEATATPAVTEEPAATPDEFPVMTPEPLPDKTPESTPSATPESTPNPTQETTIEPSASPTPDIEKESPAPVEFTNTDTNVEVKAEEGFINPEIVDERTSIYTNEADVNLKKMVMGVIRNYKTEEGYQPIDTNLVPSVNLMEYDENSSAMLAENTANVIRSYYPQESRTGIILERNDVRLTIIPQLRQISEASVEGAQLIYPMENQINLRYTVMPAWIEEELVFYEKPATNRFVSQITVENGTLADGDDHGVVVLDAQGDLSMLIRAPKAVDAAGNKTEIRVERENDLLHYSVDESWLMSDERVYPVVVDPNYFGYAHNGTDVSVSYSYPTKTLGNPNLEKDGWVLKNYDDAFMFIGDHPRYKDSYSFYKINDDRMNEVLKGKYIKKATVNLTQGRTKPGTTNELLACKIPGSYNIAQATYLNIPTNYECFTSDWTWDGCWMHSLDITPYVKDVAENNASNNGVLLTMRDPTTSYLELYASEYYYITGTGEDTPYVEVEYFNSPDITMTDVNQFTWNVRPFVKYDYSEGLTYLTAVGFDGTAPYHANTAVTVKDGDTVKFTQSMEAIDNFYRYPDYPEIEKTQSYNDTKVSNYQTSAFFDSFEAGKLYTVDFRSAKGTQTSTVKSTFFRTYEVKGFDLVSSIASFYGISKETLMKDNNLQDELITQGNLLFIREPQKNKEFNYEEEDLSADQKKQIDAALRGRDVQCEFGFEPVNLNTGNFILESQDFSMNVFQDNFTFSRAYNSSAAGVFNIFGMGWSFSGLSRIASDNQGATVMLEDGTKYYFTRQSDGSYTNALTTLFRLSWETDHFVLRNLDQTWIYNVQGLVEKVTDRQGLDIIYTYQQGLPDTITLKNGKKITFRYNAEMLVDQIQLGENDVVSYGYDNQLNLISFTDQSGSVIQYAYDDGHNMTSWINQNQVQVIANTYDDQHRVIKQIDGLGGVMTLEYLDGRTKTTDAEGHVEVTWFDDSGQTTKIEYADQSQVLKTYVKGLLTAETKENGVSWAYTYDTQGNLLTSVRSDGFTETRVYDETGNLLTLSNTAGQHESWTYNARNDVTSYTDPLGSTTVYSYNDQHQKVSETDPLGNTTVYEYNDQGCVSKVTYPDGSFYSYTYNASGFLLTATDELDRTTAHVLNARNEIVQILHPDGGVQNFTFDGAGNLISESDADGYVTSYEYDLYGNKTKMTDSLGNVTTYVYDGNQNLIQTVHPDGSQINMSVDSRGRTLSRTENGRTATYAYNQFGLSSETNDHGQTKTYTYDALGNLISTVDFDGKETLNTVDALGRVLSTTDKAGNVTVMTYDAKGQLLSQTNALQTKTMEYDARGLMTKQTVVSDDISKVTEKTLDSMGRVVSEKDPNGHVTSYAYQGNRITSMTDPLGNQTTYTYDELDRKLSETTSDGRSRSWTYDHRGNILTHTDTNQRTTTFVYDGNGRCIEQKDALGNRTSYTVDASGRTTRITKPLGNTTGFSYDLNGNLVQKTRNDQIIESYIYDRYGNLTSQTLNGLTTTFEYDTYDQLIKTTAPTGLITENTLDDLHRLIQVQVNGNIHESYVYDSFDRLISETDLYGSTTSYLVNGDGKITQKTARGVTTHYTFDLAGNCIGVTDSRENTTQYFYDAADRLIKETVNGADLLTELDLYGNITKFTDRNGNEKTLSYDGEGNLLLVNENGHTTQSVYDEVNRKITEKIDDQIVSQWVYDADSRLIKEIDGLGGIEQTVYNAAGLVSKSVDPMGYATEYTYDDHDNLISIQDAKGNTTQRQYNSLNQCVKEINRIQGITQFEYDIFGNVCKTIYPDNGVETQTYNDKNQLIQEVKTNGAVLDYSYNQYNQLLKTWQDEQLMLENIYDDLGSKVESYDALRNKTMWAYDKTGRVTLQTNALNQTQSYIYDHEDRLIRRTDEAGVTTAYTYDATDNILSESCGERVIARSYNAFNQILSETDPLGHVTVYEYDLNQRLIKTMNPLGNEILTEYNAAGLEIAKVDANGHRYEKIYDEVYNLIQEKDPLNQLTSYTYDAEGNMTSVQDARGYRVNYELDKAGQVTRRFAGDVEVLYVYNPSGELIKMTDEDGKSEEYTYDHRGNRLTVKQKDKTVITFTYDLNDNMLSKQSVTYTYDALNRISAMTDSDGTTQYTYDAAGNTTQVVRNGRTVGYEYDDFNNRTQIIYPDNTSISYEYDLAGRMIKTIDTVHNVVYEYDAAGHIVKETECNGVVITKTYDNNGNLLTQLTKLGTRILSSYTYILNEINSILKSTEILNGVTTVTDYTYDANDELIKTIRTQGSDSVTTEYVITLNGNRTEVTEGQLTYRATYDDFNRIQTYYDGEVHVTYSYDQRGNRIREARDGNTVKEYTYDELNQLVKVVDFDGTVTSYVYDGAGNRVRQTVNRENTSYSVQETRIGDSIQLLIDRLSEPKSEALEQHESTEAINGVSGTSLITTMEYVNDEVLENPEVLYKIQGSAVTKYWYGNQRVCKNEDFYLYDGLGNVTILLSGSNRILSTYSYSDYGRRDKKYNPFSSSSDEYGYRGEAHGSDETQYLRARYYDTVSQLFISADSYLGEWEDPLSQNRYLYAKNNPIKHSDPSGMRSIKNPISKAPIGKKPGGSILGKSSSNSTNPSGFRTAPPIMSQYDWAIKAQRDEPVQKKNITINSQTGSQSKGVSKAVSKANDSAAKAAKAAAALKAAQEEAARKAAEIKRKATEKHNELSKNVKSFAVKETASMKKQLTLNNLQKSTAGLNKKYPDVVGDLESRANSVCKGPEKTSSHEIHSDQVISSANNQLSALGAYGTLELGKGIASFAIYFFIPAEIKAAIVLYQIVDIAVKEFDKNRGLESVPDTSSDAKYLEKLPLDKIAKDLEKFPGGSVNRRRLIIDIPINEENIKDSHEKINVRLDDTYVEEIAPDQTEQEGNKESAGKEDSDPYYKKGLQEVPDDWIEVESPEELKIKSEFFKNFLREQGYNPKNWRKVVEKWASPDGTIYQRNYWTNGTDYYYHGEGIEVFYPH